jgi:hypothetical protein
MMNAIMPKETGNLTSVPSSAPEYFQLIHQSFDNSLRQGNQSSFDFSIAGHHVQIRFTNPGFAEFILPSLEHLRLDSPAQPPQLTIEAWDSASTHTPMPSPPWAIEDYDQRGEIRGYNDDAISAAFHLDGCIFSILNRRSNTAIYFQLVVAHTALSIGSRRRGWISGGWGVTGW